MDETEKIGGKMVAIRIGKTSKVKGVANRNEMNLRGTILPGVTYQISQKIKKKTEGS